SALSCAASSKRASLSARVRSARRRKSRLACTRGSQARGLAGQRAIEDGETLVELRPGDDERREKTQKPLGRAVDDEATPQAAFDDGSAGTVELGTEHEAEPAHLADGGVPLGEVLQAFAEVGTQLADVRQQLRPGQLFDGRDGRRTRERIAAE